MYARLVTTGSGTAAGEGPGAPARDRVALRRRAPRGVCVDHEPIRARVILVSNNGMRARSALALSASASGSTRGGFVSTRRRDHAIAVDRPGRTQFMISTRAPDTCARRWTASRSGSRRRSTSASSRDRYACSFRRAFSTSAMWNASSCGGGNSARRAWRARRRRRLGSPSPPLADAAMRFIVAGPSSPRSRRSRSRSRSAPAGQTSRPVSSRSSRLTASCGCSASPTKPPGRVPSSPRTVGAHGASAALVPDRPRRPHAVTCEWA